MIILTRLNGGRFVVNAEMIRTSEEKPDTIIVLSNGETLMVKEPMEEVVAKAIEYGRMIRTFQP
jgi:flagellar protein FlbD